VIDCIKRAKVTPITLHGLRDTHASLCAKAGVPLEVVSQRLGLREVGRLGNQKAPLHICCAEPQASRKTDVK
jgi:hypothetical protein